MSLPTAITSTAASSTGRVSAGLAADGRGLAALRQSAGQDPRAAVKEAAKQFEAMFMQELLKTMRASTEASGMLDNAGSKLGTDLLDGQLATATAGRPGGLAELIARQLERQMGLAPGPIPSTTPANASLPLVSDPAATPRLPEKSAAGFVQQHMAAARQVQAQTGIPASFMVAQAAHETGWGKKEITGRDGSASNNLFGIKAGAGWTGPSVEVMTTEYQGGQPRQLLQRFRAYASHAESFSDYARLISQSPRYAAVRAAGQDAQAFAQGLQDAGYATDPAYAGKLSRMIATTQRLQQGGA